MMDSCFCSWACQTRTAGPRLQKKVVIAKFHFFPCLQIFLKKETYLVDLLYVCFGGQACFCFFVCKQRECLEEYYANVITLLLLLYFEYFIGATCGDAAEGFLAFCGHLVFANQPPLQLQ